LRPAPTRPAPGRHRPAHQARAPISGFDEPQPERAPAPYPNGQDFRGEALDVLLAASRDIEDERRRQAEIARIRGEIMDIARDVANLRRQQTGGLANDAMQDRARPAVHQNLPRQPHHGAPQAPRASAREPQPADRQRIPNNRRHQLVERAHRQGRAGSVEATILSAPAPKEWPVLAIGDDVLPTAPPKAKMTVKPKATVKPAVNVPARANAAAMRKIASRPAKARGMSLAVKAALFTALMLAGTAAITLALRGKLPLLAHELRAVRLVADAASTPAEAAGARPAQLQLASAADQTSSLYPFTMPDTYGVYAVSEGHLTALEPLPIRVPDARVSISSAITKPAPAPVTNGAPLFLAYHRELATNVPESASVRVFARIMQASSFVGGKPKMVPVEESWAVRGGAIDLRIAPVATNKEMIMIRPADPNFTLSPGRYVLMFRNQAYDFSVAGEVSDTAHCLERSDLQDRSVYSECRELPAPAEKP
jgi:hypothetical protein